MSEVESKKKGRNRQKLGSVDAFWADNPRLLMAKQILDTVIDCWMLGLAIMHLRQDYGKVCEEAVWNDHFDVERERLCVGLMCFIHSLHICRLIFTCCTKNSKKAGCCKGCLRCLLIDCYCC